uniref:26S proteasome non-ATPase regulatory subunit 12-like n=1 Tax=Sinocyclocheilus anshuiensis TaxID=1608454 RepID=A0A671M1K8_9TELE
MSEDRAERSDGRIVKMEVDYSPTVDQRLPECEKMARDGRLQEAIESLLSLEKQTRTASDMLSTSRILVAIVQLCYEAKDWDALNENIMLLSKRRSQLKQAVTKMVQECYTYVDAMSDLSIKLRLIDTLRTITAGKNIRIMAKYYTSITMGRMAALLDLTIDESEEFLSNLVVNKTIYAKVDRLAGIINFQRPKDPNDLLNDWSQKLNSLMSLVNKTTHLIAKEEMIHNLQ